jgi:hypothetical protein
MRGKRARRASHSKYADNFDSPLDRWISYAVKVLRDAGIETYESCEGGNHHAFPEATVRFHGGRVEGFRAVTVAVNHGLPLHHLRRFWRLVDGELEGPGWEMTFYPPAQLRRVQRQAEQAGLIA